MNKKLDTNERVTELENNITRLDYIIAKDKEDYISNIEDYKKTLDKEHKNIKQIVDDGKKEIVTFTFQLISTIIGFLTLTFSIVFLWINKAEIDTLAEWILVVFAFIFIVCFLIFVHSFRKKNFSRLE